MGTTESAPEDDTAGAEQQAWTAANGPSMSRSAAEQFLPLGARPAADQRRLETSRPVTRLLTARIEAALRDDVPGRNQWTPEHREVQTEMLRFHLLRQLR